MIVVGIDPGARNTGIVLRDGDTLVDCYLVTASGTFTDYWRAVRTAVERGLYIAWTEPNDSYQVAVEDVTAPTGFKHGRREPINLTGLIGTASILGAVLGMWPDAIVVPPNKHGSGPKGAYPAELWGPREGPAGSGRLRHCRSAWDVAGAARRLSALNQRTAS